MNRTRRILASCQGAYYAVTGLWPLVSMGTFELVTGPKTDDWLVRTVGALALVIGIALFIGSRRQIIVAETALLGVTSAAAFGASDVLSVWLAGISPIYLADAFIQTVIIGVWLATWRRR